jgi:hypothetical protein
MGTAHVYRCPVPKLVPAPDPSVIRRWLTALGLLVTAEELLERGDDAASSTALIAADSACETLLGVIGSWSTKPLPREPKYEELIDRAADALSKARRRLAVALTADLRTSHATRNTVMHHGATATVAQAQLASRCARRLADLLPAVSSHFGALPAGSGFVSAIAAMVNAPDVSTQLLAGEEAVRKRDASATADAAARALAAMIRRLDPPISIDDYGYRRMASWDTKNTERAVVERLEGLGKTMAEVQGWVAASALGLHPVEVRRLREVIGRHTWYLGSSEADVRRVSEPTLDQARAALFQVAELVFRNWELGGLIEGTEEEFIARRYR